MYRPAASSPSNLPHMTTVTRPVQRGARTFHWITALLGTAALVTQLTMTIRGIDVLGAGTAQLAPTGTRVLRFFSYFTIQSNLLVIVSAVSLALQPARDGGFWRVVRLGGLLGITVTFFVYLVALLPILNLTGISLITDRIFHIVIPILAVGGWVLFGPRPRIDMRSVWWVLAWPVAYIVYILIFGDTTGWYHYPFVNVTDHGYPLVIVNGLIIAALVFAVALAYRWLDRRLTPRP